MADLRGNPQFTSERTKAAIEETQRRERLEKIRPICGASGLENRNLTDNPILIKDIHKHAGMVVHVCCIRPGHKAEMCTCSCGFQWLAAARKT
jgi:hypothetical protein